MTAEYRFLRFEIAGIITLVFYVFLTWPLVAAIMETTFPQKMEFSLAVVAALFLVSLPLGYWEHQLVVNKYRAEKRDRKAFSVLREILANEQFRQGFPQEKNFLQHLDPREESSFLTTVLELCIYSEKMKSSSGLFERLSDRWSHFYARKAVAVYAPLFAVVFWIATVVLGYSSQWPMEFGKMWLSVIIGAVVFAVNFALINPYAGKIWLEISFLETELVLANRIDIVSVLSSIVKPENLKYLTRFND
jgi:hypothetical protein